MTFRQVDQRHVPTEISLMEWSPTMDLIALVTVQGEVLLHRLSWQRVWTLPPRGSKDKEVKVTALAWRPDGKVLAIAYDTIGNIFLSNIENSETIHLLKISGIVTCLKWVDNVPLEEPKPVFYSDYSQVFLPKHFSVVKNYSLNKSSEESEPEDSKRIKEQDAMNMLIVGTDAGQVHLYAFGMFHCGHVDIQISNGASKILSVVLTEDFSLLTAFVETKLDEGFVYRYKTFSLPLLRRKTEEFRVVALKYGQIASLFTFLSATIRSISEAWEDVLLEIDSKLMKYSVEKNKISCATISDDFLELLMFGTPSDALEKFLLHDLTENGLKKFSHSIELSYSNIQKLVLKKLQNVASSLFYNLSDVKGIALWNDRFGELGMSPNAVKIALSSVGSFLMKAIDIQQVIDNSMKNFKAFFRWLYAVILRLSDEPIPPEITKVTQQDLSFVADFLKENFTDDQVNTSSNVNFKLERVGQYLKNEKLSFPASVQGNAFISYLEQNPCLKESDLIFPYHPEMSLIQQYHDVCKTIEAAFSGPQNIFHKAVLPRSNHILFKHSEAVGMKITHSINMKNGYCISVFTAQQLPVDHLYILAESSTDPVDIKCLGLSFGKLPNLSMDESDSKTPTKPCSSYKVFDAKFYNDSILSVLLSENSGLTSRLDCPVLLQMPLKAICNEMLVPINADGSISTNIPVIDAEKYVEKTSHKKLENCKVIELAVSGSRKVACILFASRRQVRLFEMEVEDEDDDPDETEFDESMKEFDRDDPFEYSTTYSNSLEGNKENSPL